MSGPELSVECGLRNRKNQAAYLLAHNSPTKSRREFLPSRSLHIYQNKLAQRVNLCFKYVPNFGYAAAMSFFILLLVAVLALIQMRVGDKRD